MTEILVINSARVSATNIYSILCVGVMYEAEKSHIKKLLEEVLDEESNVEVGYESDLWSDHQSGSDHNTESEDDADADADPENTSDSATGNQVSNLVGKVRNTEWSTIILTKNKRTRSCNIIRTHLPCVRRESKNCKIPIELRRSCPHCLAPTSQPGWIGWPGWILLPQLFCHQSEDTAVEI